MSNQDEATRRDAALTAIARLECSPEEFQKARDRWHEYLKSKLRQERAANVKPRRRSHFLKDIKKLSGNG